MQADTIAECNRQGKGVSVCGEMAGDVSVTRLLLGMGLRSFSMHPAQILAVKQEVLRADAAKLAKGTVYLYFSSKEEMLLALHGRHVHTFFQAMFKLLQRTQPLTIDDMVALTREHIVGTAAFLPLAALCMGVMEKAVDAAEIDKGAVFGEVLDDTGDDCAFR